MIVNCPVWRPISDTEETFGRCLRGGGGGNPSRDFCENICRLGGATPASEVPISPCAGCGDKTNIAQIKSDPAAIERMLAGE